MYAVNEVLLEMKNCYEKRFAVINFDDKRLRFYESKDLYDENAENPLLEIDCSSTQVRCSILQRALRNESRSCIEDTCPIPCWPFQCPFDVQVRTPV